MSGDRWSQWLARGGPNAPGLMGDSSRTSRERRIVRTAQAGVYVYTGGTVPGEGGIFGAAVLIRRDPPRGGRPRWFVGQEGGPYREAKTLSRAEEIAAEIVAEEGGPA